MLLCIHCTCTSTYRVVIWICVCQIRKYFLCNLNSYVLHKFIKWWKSTKGKGGQKTKNKKRVQKKKRNKEKKKERRNSKGVGELKDEMAILHACALPNSFSTTMGKVIHVPILGRDLWTFILYTGAMGEARPWEICFTPRACTTSGCCFPSTPPFVFYPEGYCRTLDFLDLLPIIGFLLVWSGAGKCKWCTLITYSVSRSVCYWLHFPEYNLPGIGFD